MGQWLRAAIMSTSAATDAFEWVQWVVVGQNNPNKAWLMTFAQWVDSGPYKKCNKKSSMRKIITRNKNRGKGGKSWYGK